MTFNKSRLLLAKVERTFQSVDTTKVKQIKFSLLIVYQIRIQTEVGRKKAEEGLTGWRRSTPHTTRLRML